jgi:hypothetical protein
MPPKYKGGEQLTIQDFYLGPVMASRRFPPPWTVEDIGGSFVVKASNDRPLVFIYYRESVGRRSLAKLLTRNAARRIAAGIAKLPERR